MELSPGSSTINTFLALDLTTLQQYIPIIFFFTGNSVIETVRGFKLWLFGLINGHGGARGRFIPPTFDIGNIFIYHELRLVSCNFVGKLIFFCTECLSADCTRAVISGELGASNCCHPITQPRHCPGCYRVRKGQPGHHFPIDGAIPMTRLPTR